MQRIGPLFILALITSAQTGQHNGTTSSSWTKEPDQFKGVKWNASLEEAKSSAAFDKCTEIESGTLTKGHTICEMTTWVTDDYAISWAFVFNNGRFANVSGGFPAKYYEDVRSLFITKYGRPTSVNHEQMRTGLGVPYTQETLTWRGKTIALIIYRFSDTVDEGTVVFIPVATMIEDAKRNQESKRRALQ
ncbi:MAG: hypothetical protein WB992_01570 [Bryobacteraceae bacterium]